jgi:hypothetical protein
MRCGGNIYFLLQSVCSVCGLGAGTPARISDWATAHFLPSFRKSVCGRFQGFGGIESSTSFRTQQFAACPIAPPRSSAPQPDGVRERRAAVGGTTVPASAAAKPIPAPPLERRLARAPPSVRARRSAPRTSRARAGLAGVIPSNRFRPITCHRGRRIDLSFIRVALFRFRNLQDAGTPGRSAEG